MKILLQHTDNLDHPKEKLKLSRIPPDGFSACPHQMKKAIELKIWTMTNVNSKKTFSEKVINHLLLSENQNQIDPTIIICGEQLYMSKCCLSVVCLSVVIKLENFMTH